MSKYLSPGIYVEEVEAGLRPIEGVGTAVAAFVGMAGTGPLHAPTLVTNWTQFSNAFGGFTEGCLLAHAVYGYFNNGGSVAYIVRVGGDTLATAPSAQGQLTAGGESALGAYRVSAIDGGPAGNEISVEVLHPEEGGADTFRLDVRRGEQVESFDGLTTARRHRQNAVTVVNARSRLVRLEELTTADGALERPAPGAVVLHGGSQPAASVAPGEYVGDSAERTGFAGLESVETVTMLCVPDLMGAYAAGRLDLEQVKAVQLAMISHCELMGDRMAILDTPPGLNAQQVREWRLEGAGYDSKYAALYWPHIKVFDPPSGKNVFVPPSGHLAGLWARTDGQRGVHKAPANDVLLGVVDLETRITRGEHDLLNPVGVNCLRPFSGRGIRVWGARTLSSDPAWRYIHVRRLFNYVESSILAGTSWTVFEPNDPDLWGRVRRTIRTFLYQVWLDGALFGLTPEQAFYVKCDDETNPTEVIEAGQLVCEIGIAAVKTAEFVVFRLAQLPTGTSALSE